MIKTIIDKEKQLTKFIFSETITLDSILKEIEHFYNTDPTPHTLWNFTNADLSDIHPDQIRGVAEYAKKMLPNVSPAEPHWWPV